MSKSALVFGSTGLVGSALLTLLLESEDFSKIVIFVRKHQNIIHPKLEEVIVDFDHIEGISDHIKGDSLFICLGTTMARAGSKEAFYKVDYTYVMKIATIAAANKIGQLCLVSSMGADPSSSVYYSRVKGELERDIQKLNFRALHILRPSLLLGDRKEKRLGERVAVILSRLLSFLFIGPLQKYKPINDITVAGAMLSLAKSNTFGLHIYESQDIERLDIHQIK